MKEDPRITKTLGKLQTAFVMLLKTYDVEDINVRQISDEAGVTRGAFYSHFSDKNEFVRFTTNKLVHTLFDKALVDSAEFINDEDNGQTVNVLSISHFFNNVSEHYQTYTIIMGADKLPGFKKELREQLIKEFKRFVEYYSASIELDGFPIDVLSSYYVNGIIGMVNMWLENGMVYTAHYMASATKKLLGTKAEINGERMKLSDFFVD